MEQEEQVCICTPVYDYHKLAGYAQNPTCPLHGHLRQEIPIPDFWPEELGGES